MKRLFLQSLVAAVAAAAIGAAHAQVQERAFKLGLQNPKGPRAAARSRSLSSPAARWVATSRRSRRCRAAPWR